MTDGYESPGIAGGSFAVIEQSATHLILAVAAPGAYCFRTGAQDPRLSLPDYKLTASFLDASAPRVTMKDEAPAEESVEVDPDPNLAPVEQPGHVDPDPDSVTVESAIGQRLAGLCRAALSDDHGDTSTCATPVRTGRGVPGELANGWGDDYDYFTFTLTDLETVAVGTSGPTDTFGALFDSSGRRLATDDNGGGGDNFLIVRTLSPGRYVVRVEGAQHAEGLYELALETAGW